MANMGILAVLNGLTEGINRGLQLRRERMQEEALLGLKEKQFEFEKKTTGEELALKKEELRVKQKEVAAGNINLTEFERADDLAWAKTLQKWNDGGGFVEAKRDIAALDSVMNFIHNHPGVLKGEGDAAIWKAASELPIIGKVITAYQKKKMPINTAIKESVHQIALKQVKHSLDQRFTEQEGIKFADRSYDETLPDEINLARMADARNMIFEAAKMKERARAYALKHRTMKGFTAVLADVKAPEFMYEALEQQLKKKQQSAKEEFDPYALVPAKRRERLGLEPKISPVIEKRGKPVLDEALGGALEEIMKKRR